MQKDVWWQPATLKNKLPNLRLRGDLKRALQAYFSDSGFTEVETPALQVSPGMEPHLTAFTTALENTGGKKIRDLYLHTSPEFAMKKLLAGGSGDIYQFARVFRNREGSATHHPEFTMIEWYRVGAEYTQIMNDCENLLKAGGTLAPDKKFHWQGRVSDPFQAWEKISVCEAFRKYAGIDLEESLGNGLRPDTKKLAESARAAGIQSAPNDEWDDIFFRIFLEKVETKLGIGSPTILYDYPACMAALSRRKKSDPRLAERFELYVCGLELANAFGELTDAREQRARFEADMAKKEFLYGFRYPIDEEFIRALELGLPECAGIALGFDRLAMLVAGVENIEDVLWATVTQS